MKNDAINVLLIEDNVDDVELLRLTLPKEETPHFELDWAGRLSTGISKLESGNYDIVLLDLYLPDSHGHDTFDRVHEVVPALPVVILTGLNDERLALEAMQKGAQNYLVKGQVDRQTLSRTMRYAIHRQKTELSLRAGKENLQQEMDSFFELSLDMFGVAGFDGVLKVVNPAWQKTLGWDAATLLSKPLLEFIHPNDRAATGNQMKQLLRGEIIIHFENRFICKDGSYKWLQWDANPLQEREKIYAVARDITERKRSAEKLREISLAFENSVEGIARIDATGTIMATNGAYAQTLGFRPEEMAGRELMFIVHPEDREKISKALETSASAGKSEVEIKALRKDNAALFVQMSLIKTLSERGEFTGHYSFVKDITSRILEEEKQKQLLARLEKVNRELNEFSYVVSHDLKAPLRGIGSLVSWLASDYNDKFDDDGKENLNLLVGRVKRMHDLIEGLLQVAKVGRVENETAWVDLNTIVKESMDFVSPPPGIKLKIGTKLPRVRFSKVDVQQVVQNLIGNAVKYMGKPKGTITVACEEDDAQWTVSVRDTGPGINEKHFRKIFQIFQTLTPRDSFESTGIGLALVKKIVETNGGRVWVESKVGEGSTFFFTILKTAGKGEVHDAIKKQAA